MILVSACLAGVKCSWDGKDRSKEEIKKLVARKLALPVCPEVLGGRPVPRTMAEMTGGAGACVLAGTAKVFDENGLDITQEFIRGAHAALEIVKRFEIKEALLKAKSPSCGVGRVYDGSFKARLVSGDGVTTALLKKEGVRCREI